jgi:hypothetical protein
MTILFRILCGIDVLVAAIFLYFFLWGVADGTVSAFNIGLWLLILGGIAAVLGGGWALKAAGHRGSANALLAVLAVPSAGFGLLFLLLALTVTNWH